MLQESLYYINKLSHTLVNTNKVQYYGIICWDTPFDNERESSLHVIGELMIIIQFQWTKAAFLTCKKMQW